MNDTGKPMEREIRKFTTKIEINIDYDFTNDSVVRTVLLDGKQVYTETLTTKLFMNDRNIIRQLELFAIGKKT